MAKKTKFEFEEDTMADAALKGLENADFGCRYCRHLHSDRVTCDAFPKMIPVGIIVGDIVHNKEHIGDSGIRWELSDKYEKVGLRYVLK